MAFIPTPGAVRTALVQSYDNQTIVNTLWGYKNAVISPTDLDNMNGVAILWWQTNILPYVGAGMTLNSCTSYDQSAADAPSLTELVTSGNQGTYTGAPLPGNVSIVISFRTANRGRTSRGRMYIGGLTAQAQGAANEITSGFRTAMINAAVDLVAKLAFVGFQHVVVSHFANKAPRTTGLVQPVTGQVVDTLLDSQRRRLAARGV
jgi:hypothetical protein